ncbi:hypothetical protein HMPREF2572_02885 [Neisseria sp. HMSC064E01]|nr:hypothetical protein HMPREF2572_02885 [Neisseria sp. HMSC064E01]
MLWIEFRIHGMRVRVANSFFTIKRSSENLIFKFSDDLFSICLVRFVQLKIRFGFRLSETNIPGLFAK